MYGRLDCPVALSLIRRGRSGDAEEFTDVQLQRFTVDHRYTAEQYLDLLSTFSNHRALPRAHRDGLFTCLRQRIDAEPARAITKSVAFELTSAVNS